ncbi:hypothetical protein T4D_8904 [Trichinella pseudospiralis]|uniref:Uncharacterized protein n=1 Tax=Trichinella pseudospiralis TaxID=6337 RepID=A0A0V1FSB4_TRIPS|nr:hypothetical protein T4D_8904 [Trichinella pseudospiralis]
MYKAFFNLSGKVFDASAPLELTSRTSEIIKLLFQPHRTPASFHVEDFLSSKAPTHKNSSHHWVVTRCLRTIAIDTCGYEFILLITDTEFSGTSFLRSDVLSLTHEIRSVGQFSAQLRIEDQ